MDSSNHNNGLHNPYMQYNNAGFDPAQFLNDVQEYSASSNDAQSQFDPALFDIPSDLASYQSGQQPSDATGYNQPNPQQRTQSPGLSQFKQNSNPYASHPYSQNIFNSQLNQYDNNLLQRQSQSPNHFSAQRGMNFHQQQPDPRYNAYYQHPPTQQETSQTPTPPPFQQTPNQQPQQRFMNMSMPNSQLQHMQNSHNYTYTFQSNPSTTHTFIDPNLLNPGQNNYPGMSGDLQSHNMNNQSFYGKPAGNSTVDPRSLQHAQFAESNALQMRNGPAQNDMGISQAQMQPHMQHPSQKAMQSVLQFTNSAQTTKDPNAPKRPRGRPRKNPLPAGASSGSEDDLEIEDEPPEPKPSPLCLEKPTDPRGRLLYEVVEAVWAPRNKPALSEKIRTGVAVFGDSVRTLRDMWKGQNEKLKKAELPNSGTAVQTSALKADVAQYRQDMQDLVTRALRYSHPSILRRLGENSFAMSAMYSFLLDRVTSDDYDSSLVVAILQLASHFETMDEDHLEKVKWTKILSTRISKKSTNNSKELALRILANAKAATARKAAEGLAGGPASPSNSSNGRAPVSVAGVKRGRDERETIQQAMAKKAAIKPSSKPLSVLMEERRKAREKEKAAAAKDSKGDKQSVNGGPNSTATRPKVAATAPIKTSPFVLQSASKKVGTTNAERAAATAKDKVDVVAKDASGTLITPGTTTPTIKKEAPKSDITTTSKTNGSALAASGLMNFLSSMDKPKEAPVRKVVVDPNETPEEREKRLRKEERRKLRVSWRPDDELVQVKIFEHDLDEETGHDDSMVRDVGNTAKEGEMLKRHVDQHDDDDSEDEEEAFVDVYALPSEVDFETMDQESRDGNFLKTGGSNIASSPASEAQAKHEEGNLMTMFTFRDQPETPKEPPAEDEDENFDPVVDFGEPSDPLVRHREQQMLAHKQQYQQKNQQAPTNGFDLSQILAGMANQPQPQQNQWQNAPNMFGQSNQQAAQQPSSGGIDIQKLLSVAGQYSQLQQAQQQQSSYQSAPAAQASFNPQLAALLAQFSGQQQAQPAMNGSQFHNGTNTNSYGGADEGYGRKEKKKGKVPLGPDGKPLNYKTQVCSFWKEGKCMKGDACTYRHDE